MSHHRTRMPRRYTPAWRKLIEAAAGCAVLDLPAVPTLDIKLARKLAEEAILPVAARAGILRILDKARTALTPAEHRLLHMHLLHGMEAGEQLSALLNQRDEAREQLLYEQDSRHTAILNDIQRMGEKHPRWSKERVFSEVAKVNRDPRDRSREMTPGAVKKHYQRGLKRGLIKPLAAIPK